MSRCAWIFAAVIDVGRPSFVAESLSELNVGLYEGSKLMHRAALALLAGSTGWGFSSEADRLIEDVRDQRCSVT
jgi:hypothetical protein